VKLASVITQPPRRGEKIVDANGAATRKFITYLESIDSQETTNTTEQSIEQAVGNIYTLTELRSILSRALPIGDIIPNTGNFTTITVTTVNGTTVAATTVNATDVNITGVLKKSVTDGITAGTTQTQAGATALTTDVNRIATCANVGDVVGLPQALAGKTCKIINDGANNAQVFPKTSGDNIDSEAANAVDPNALAAGTARTYECLTDGTWRTG
jgi:hypothetical protein